MLHVAGDLYSLASFLGTVRLRRRTLGPLVCAYCVRASTHDCAREVSRTRRLPVPNLHRLAHPVSFHHQVDPARARYVAHIIAGGVTRQNSALPGQTQRDASVQSCIGVSRVGGRGALYTTQRRKMCTLGAFTRGVQSTPKLTYVIPHALRRRGTTHHKAQQS